MGDIKVRGVEEDGVAEVDIWNYVFGFVNMAVVKCAIELGIADAIENLGSPMTLSELTTALGCEPSRLYRIMRFLVHYQIFKEEPISQDSIGFSLTPLSRRLIRRGEKSMAALILLESNPAMLASYHSLSARVLESGNSPFEAANGKDIWSYAEANPGHSKLIDEAMACDTRVAVPAVIEGCPEVFDALGSLVDVGGGNGTALSMLVKAFPWIRGINFDLPRVVAVAPKSDGIENVGGDMFECVPNADAAFFMWVLHDWGDEECIKILQKCREAIPQDKGKVIIVEAVLEEDKNDKLDFVRLMLDMAMMAHTNKGKERTLKEWSYVLEEAGFSRFNVHAASLIHDDLPCMDDDPVRRGQPSNHTSYGVDMAILAGDALFPLGFRHIVSHTPTELVPEARLLRVIAEIAPTVGSSGMAAGQFLDLKGGPNSVDFIQEKKLGEMSECSAVCGGLLAVAEDDEIERLRRYGRAVGVLYEVVNDVLEAKLMGKEEMEKNQKKGKSYVSLYGVEKAMKVVEELWTKAKNELDGFDKYGDSLAPLYSFIDYAVDRGFNVGDLS